MVDLIATKAMTYGTRRLLPDTAFSARTGSDARALVALGHARYAEPEDAPAKPKRAKKAKAAS